MGKATKIVLFGALGLVGSIGALQAIGRDGEDSRALQTEAAAAASEAAQAASEAVAAASLASGQASAAVAGAPPSASSVWEQAVFDAFPVTAPKTLRARKTASQAADMIGFAINSNGHLCARPVEMQRVSDGLYGIGCITRRDGSGRSNYLLNVRTGEVSEI